MVTNISFQTIQAELRKLEEEKRLEHSHDFSFTRYNTHGEMDHHIYLNAGIGLQEPLG